MSNIVKLHSALESAAQVCMLYPQCIPSVPQALSTTCSTACKIVLSCSTACNILSCLSSVLQLLSLAQSHEAQQHQQQHGVHDASARRHSSSVTAQGHQPATASIALPHQLAFAPQLQQPGVHSHNTVSYPTLFEQNPTCGLAETVSARDSPDAPIMKGHAQLHPTSESVAERHDSFPCAAAQSATCDPATSSQHQSHQSQGQQEGPIEFKLSADPQPSANVKSTQLPDQTSMAVQSNDVDCSVQHSRSQSSPSQPALNQQPPFAPDDMPATENARASTDHAIAPAGPVEPICVDVPASQSAVVADATAMSRPAKPVTVKLVEQDAGQAHSESSEHVRYHLAQQASNHAMGSGAAANGTSGMDHANGIASNGHQHQHLSVIAADGLPALSPSKVYNGTVVGDVQKVLDAALWGTGTSVSQKRQLNHGAAATEGDLPSKRQCVSVKEFKN